ncbi:MAG: ATP-grasp domain-containing protein [Firmicutes bacterium]|nr:ATP-grasp domain-containing protein [Bacillota bacterium]
MKKLLILGASVYQVPLIKTANSMGLYTIVSSIPGNYPGFAFAQKTYDINTIDRDAIFELAKTEGIDGITTTGTDVAVATIGYVNERMGLSGISEEAARRTTDKAVMKESFKSGGVSASEFYKAYDSDSAKAAAEKIGYPVVVKCVDSSGSRGITTVREEAALQDAFESAMAVSRKDYVLIEEELKGQEIGVDAIVSDGKLAFFAPHLKFTYPNGGITITAGHAFPYRDSAEVIDEIRLQIERAVKALGVDNCALNADVFIDGNKVSIIEIGGRAGATCIPELISKCYGFDYYEAIIDCALGQKPNIPENPSELPCMAKLLMSPVDGTITRIDTASLEEIRDEGVDVALDYGEGDSVEEMINGTTRIGHVIAFASEERELDAIMKRVYRNIYVDGKSLEELWEA